MQVFKALSLLFAPLFLVITIAGAGGGPVLGEKRHGLSAFGDLKYPADFKHFDYVNPQAPKGGRLATTSGGGTFNSFNAYILKGDAAEGLALLFDTLMARAADEPDAVYGLAAHSASLAEDRKSVIFYLRPEARFAGGSALTAHDAVFTLNILKEKGHPLYVIQLQDVVRAEALDAHTVRYDFKGEHTRDLAMNVAQLPIFSKAYYGKHPFDQTTLQPPLGSGPYEIADYKQGALVTYKRRKDYWGSDLPVKRGQLNFDEIRFEYFRDRTTEFEALKANAYDLREEFTSKTWATEYDIPQVRSGRLKRETIPDERPSGAQGFFINARHAKFSDPRVRKALDYAFDFKWTNKTLFYGMYKRTESFFENSDMKSEGAPSPAELALLEPFRDKLPASIFEEVYRPPHSDGSGQDRRNLRMASALLEEAGWTVKDGKRVNARGEPLDIEFLLDEPLFERIIGHYVKNLNLIGVSARIRRVDPAQYQERVKSFDFDIVSQRYALSQTPGPEIKAYWGSEAANAKGSYNLAGIAHPVIDALIGKMLAAKSRAELKTAARALDRVLRAGHYWVPHWYKAAHHLAFWDKFSWPPVKPKYDRGVMETWWYDAEKAAKLGKPPSN